MTPEGQTVNYDGHVYLVTADRKVFVRVERRGNPHWREIGFNSPTAIAVRHQATHGHVK